MSVGGDLVGHKVPQSLQVLVVQLNVVVTSALETIRYKDYFKL